MNAQQHPPDDSQPDPDAISQARRRARGLRPVRRSALTPGKTIAGRYELEEELVSGGLGLVWLGRDTTLDDPVALRFLPRALASDAAVARELRDTARPVLELRHANVAQLRDVRFFEGSAFFVEEYQPGGSLAELVRSRGRALTSAEALWVLTQATAVLGDVHGAGLTHLDLKPSNLLLDRPVDGRLDATSSRFVLSGLGLGFAAREALSRSTGLWPSNSLPYFAPELVQGRPSSFATDVYGLSASLYALITGAAPFGGEKRSAEEHDSETLTERILYDNAPPLNSGHAGLDAAIAAGLAKDPRDRPATMAELAEIAGISAPATRGRAWRWVAAAGLLVGAAAVAALFFGPGRDALESIAPQVAAMDFMPVSESVPAGEQSASGESLAALGTIVPASEGAEGGAERTVPADAEEVAPLEPAPPDALEPIIAKMAQADDLASVLAIAAEAHALGRCSDAAESTVAAVRRVAPLHQLPAEAPAAEWVSAIADFESAVDRLDCSPETFPGLYGGVALPLRFEAPAESLAAIVQHAVDGHACAFEHGLAAPRRAAIADATKIAAEHAAAGRFSAYLEAVAVLERTGAASDPALDPRHLAAELLASADHGEWMSILADHRRERHACLAEGFLEVVLREAWSAELDLLFEKARTTHELVDGLARLEQAVGASDPIVQALVGDHVLRRTAERRRGKEERAMEAFLSISNYFRVHESTAFESGLRTLAEHAHRVLIDWVEGKGKVEAAAEVAREVLAGESPEPIADLGASLLQAVRDALVEATRFAYQRALNALRNENGNPARNYRSAAESLSKVTRHMGGSPPLQELYVNLLLDQGDWSLKAGIGINEDWRSRRSDKMFSSPDFTDALKCAKTLLEQPGLSDEDRIQALELALGAEVEFARHFTLLCGEHYEERGRLVWTYDRNLVPSQHERIVPRDEFDKGEDFVREGRARMAELLEVDPGNERAGGAQVELEHIQEALNEVRPRSDTRSGQ